ncbi:MAG TPA: Lpg1974 family pore-forming outer membrane protein [Chlamydiales bacterium]|nr:Lpg1974 family pore-forming outer membrane protein [Chlamydiales bacterium]
MNLFPNKAPWLVVSLIAATSAFGQDNQGCPAPAKKCVPGQFYEQGHGLDCTQLPAVYNASSRIDVNRCWNVYADGSFIYWQPQQENMELGISSTILEAEIASHGLQGSFIGENFQYKPGFKIGVGMNFEYDAWDAYAEYTWLHGADSTSSNGNILALWGMPEHGENSAESFTSAEGTWRFKFDFVDVELARSYYVGKKLSFRPSLGLRGAWIRQKHLAHYVNTEAVEGATLSNWIITDRSVSQGVGPRVGIGTNWMFGRGFRIYADGAADILYTRYNVSTTENDTDFLTWNPNIEQRDVGYLRTHLDLELGIGWGSYYNCNAWHVDLSAGYGFQAFFNQNMFRHFNALVEAYSYSPNGNLYIQGLTAMMRIDY